MEPTQAKPPKKRRRWLIVAFVLGIVSLCSWWYWPRIDPTFIGKWRISTTDTKRSYGPCWLGADGKGQVVVRQPRGQELVSVVYQFMWRVEGRSVAILVSNKSGFLWWDKAMGRAYEYTKNPFFLARDRFSIDRKDAGTAELTGSTAISSDSFLPAAFSLNRIPE